MNRDRMVQLVALALLLGCVTGTTFLSPAIHKQRHDLELTFELDSDGQTPPAYVLTAAALGSFRGLVVDALWYRAEQLRRQGRVYEFDTLATWITTLQPRFPSVWQFHSWNLAYNVSVMTHTPEERWMWVEKSIDLLRDKGIPNNPRAIKLYRELGRTYYYKIGGYTDDMHWTYKRKVVRKWEQLLGRPPFGATTEATVAQFKLIADAADRYFDLDKRPSHDTLDRLETLIDENSAVADELERLRDTNLRDFIATVPDVQRALRNQRRRSVADQLDPLLANAKARLARWARAEGDSLEILKADVPVTREAINGWREAGLELNEEGLTDYGKMLMYDVRVGIGGTLEQLDSQLQNIDTSADSDDTAYEPPEDDRFSNVTMGQFLAELRNLASNQQASDDAAHARRVLNQLIRHRGWFENVEVSAAQFISLMRFVAASEPRSDAQRVAVRLFEKILQSKRLADLDITAARFLKLLQFRHERREHSDAEGEGLRQLVAFLRAKVLIENYNMDPYYMYTLMQAYGPLDWRHWHSHAFYWSVRGLKMAGPIQEDNKFDVLNTHRQAIHSLQEMLFNGRLEYNPFLPPREQVGTPMPDPRFVSGYEKKVAEARDVSNEITWLGQGNQEAFDTGHENFLHKAIMFTFFYGSTENAQELYDRVRDLYGGKPDSEYTERYKLPVDKFAMAIFRRDQEMRQATRAGIAGMLHRGLRQGLGYGQTDVYQKFRELARVMHAEYNKDQTREVANAEGLKTGLPPFEDIEVLVYADFLRTQRMPIYQRSRIYRNLPANVRARVYEQISAMLPADYFPPPGGQQPVPQPSQGQDSGGDTNTVERQ